MLDGVEGWFDCHMDKMKSIESVFEFDGYVRSRACNLNSAHKLYRDLACDRYIPHIDVPTLVLISEDDPITQLRFVPRGDLIRNPEILYVEAKYGGHCDFFSTSEQDGELRRFWQEILFNYFDLID